MESNRTVDWSETLKRPVAEARHVLEEVSREARHALGELGQAGAPVRKSVEEAVVAHPIKAIGISLAVGVLLGWLFKRS